MADLVNEFIILLATLRNAPEETLLLYGAIGALFGVIWFLFIERTIKPARLRWTIYIILAVMAVYVTHVAESSLGISDPSNIVLDEFVAIPFIFLGYTVVWKLKDYIFVPLGLIFFGIFDRFKILGIEYAELLPAGVGIVADDVIAALYAATGLYFLKKILFKYFNWN